MNSDKIVERAKKAIEGKIYLSKPDLVPGMLVVEVDEDGELLLYKDGELDEIPTDPFKLIERMNVFEVKKPIYHHLLWCRSFHLIKKQN